MTDNYAPSFMNITQNKLQYVEGGTVTDAPVGGGASYSGLLFNLSAYADLPTADAAAAAAGGILYLDKNSTLAANYTITAVGIRHAAGVITLGNFNLILTGADFSADFLKVFALTGSGVPTFRPGQAVKIDWFGPNGSTDQTAITAAIAATPVASQSEDYLLSHGTLVGRPGAKYILTAGIVINKTINVDMGQSYIEVPTSFTGITLDIKRGSGSSNTIYNVDLNLPKIRKSLNGSNSSWSEAATMLRLSNIRLSTISIPQIFGGQYGLVIEADNNGFVQNKVQIGRITNSKFGIKGTWTSGGWINGNMFYGAKIELGTGAPTSTTGCIYFDMSGGTGAYQNTNLWQNLCIECTDANVKQAKISGMGNIYDLITIENSAHTSAAVELMSDSSDNIVRLDNATAYGAQISNSGTNNSVGWVTGSSSSSGDAGSWTPTCSVGTISVNNATYSKANGVVYVNFDITMPSSASSSDGIIAGLPFSASTTYFNGSIGYTDSTAINVQGGVWAASATSFKFRTAVNGGYATFANLSGKRLVASFTYST